MSTSFTGHQTLRPGIFAQQASPEKMLEHQFPL